MRELFTRGLRGEAQKETEVGLVPASWTVDLLAAHFAVTSGGTPSRTEPRYWHPATIPWIKTTEVDYCLIGEAGEFLSPAGLANSAAKLLPVGTLLMAMYGQGVTRGKVAMLGIEAACNQACAAINPSTNTIATKFAYHYFTWRYESIRTLAHGGQQQNLNLELVRSLPIAFPRSSGEQQEVVAILDTLDQKLNLHRRKRAMLDELFKSLLHKLMTGEIDVNDLDLSALETQRMGSPT